MRRSTRQRPSNWSECSAEGMFWKPMSHCAGARTERPVLVSYGASQHATLCEWKRPVDL